VCLILFAWRVHERYPLVVAANRDEFHSRPSRQAHWWADDSSVLAGRDLQAGGTWMGVSRNGRFAAVTNYREPQAPEPQLALSRGHLVREFLVSDEPAWEHARRLRDSGRAYSGFSLLLGDGQDLVCASNRIAEPVLVAPGSHALSNHLLDTDWPKAHHGRLRLDQLLRADRLDPESLLEVLADRSLVPGEEPEAFELRLAPERLTRTAFIVSPEYGTRSCTVLLADRDSRIEYVERQIDARGDAVGTVRFEFQATAKTG
jgi:uncharacterized protein with NRDE domain